MAHEHKHSCDHEREDPPESWTAVKVGLVLLGIMLGLIWRYT